MSEANPMAVEAGVRAFLASKGDNPEAWFRKGLAAYITVDARLAERNQAIGLTRRTRCLMLYIQNYYDEHQYFPSFDEMRDALSLASKSGIHRMMTMLEERGYIHKAPHQARAMTILRRITDKEAGQ